MTDIHTHILQGIDDGPARLDEAKEMLLAQKRSGVDRVMLTPHFNCQMQDIDEFVERREACFKQLKAAVKGLDVPKLKLGSEVVFSPELIQPEIFNKLRLLTLGGGRYLLMELPYSNYPAFIKEIAALLIEAGIVPVLAHVERYAYLHAEPETLMELVNLGALAQVNIDSLANRRGSTYAAACVKHKLVHVVASDAHDMCIRPPRLAELHGLLDDIAVNRVESFASAIWGDKPVKPDAYTAISKSIFGKYV